MCGSTIHESMKRFSIVVRECFESEHLKQTTHVDILCQVNINEGEVGLACLLDLIVCTGGGRIVPPPR